MGSRVIPGMFKGNMVTAENVMSMMIFKKLCGVRQHINGSTFAKDQMPTTTGDNKQWKRVVRPPNAEERKQIDIPWATTIEARVPGSTSTSTIMIHYLLGNVKGSNLIRSKQFLKKHTKVRVIVGESGTMIAAGSRVDYVSSSQKRFVATSPETLSKHLVKTNGIIASTICQSTLVDTPCWSSNKKNCPWSKMVDGVKIPVLL